MEEEDLNDLKSLLAKHYAAKSTEEADKLWNAKGLAVSFVGLMDETKHPQFFAFSRMQLWRHVSQPGRILES